MSRRSIPLVILATLSVLTVAALSVSLSETADTANPIGGPADGFGGYRIQVHTTEIGAQWRVPAIDPSSGDSGAATWIAVANKLRQFIQIGTLENSVGAVASYNIFWSDVAVGFHPQMLGEANAGDLITFTMIQVTQGWRLSFHNVAKGTSRTFVVPYAAGSPFGGAEWIQEDPTIGGPSNHIRYPTMEPPAFRRLTLNDAAPRLQEEDATVLSTANGVFLVPTTDEHDEFTLTGATGPARQYLRDIFAYNAALYGIQVSVSKMQSPSASDLRKIKSTLAALGHNLRRQTWPSNVVSAVQRDEKFVSDFQKIYNHFSVAPSPLNERELTQLKVIDERDGPYADALRHALGLPPAS